MAKREKVIGKTPFGGDYSEIIYFDDEGNNVDAKDATRCVVRECKKDGTLINEMFGTVNEG